MITINHSEYQIKARSKSDECLRFIIRDAKEAIVANPEGEKARYYADEVCYCSMELTRRSR